MQPRATLHSAFLLVLIAGTSITFTQTTKCPTRCICDATQGLVNCSRTSRTLVPTDLPAYTKLLDLTFNSISQIPPNSFSNLKFLDEIDLSNNNLGDDSITEQSFAKVKNISILHLSVNQFNRIPKHLPKNITFLTLIQNSGITDVSADAFEGIDYLYHVDLSYNKITTIHPDAFLSVAESLGELYIEFCNISKAGLPSTVFSSTKKLNLLGMRFNPIEIIPENLPKSMQHLDLVSINMSVIPKGPLNNLGLLNDFATWENPLKNIEDNAFVGLSHLTLVDMNTMSLTRVTKHTFAGLSKLKTLYLYENKISDIEDGAFDWFEHPQELWLGGNQLQTLPQSFQTAFTKPELDYLDLTFNPWRCDCHLKWLKVLQEKSDVIKDPHIMVCNSPPVLKGKAWDQLNASNFTCT